MLDENNVAIKGDEDKVEAFNDYFINIGLQMKSRISKAQISHINEGAVNDSLFLTPVSQNEVIKHIGSLKNASASGPDGMSVKLVKECHKYILQPLIYLIDLCFETGEIPLEWKNSIVTPVFKSGNKKQLTNYRPISVINNFAKIFEKCLKERLVDFLNKHNIISDRQFGFRQGFSTSNAVIELMKSIVYNIDADNKCLAVFVDLAKAFDTVDHQLLMERLEKSGVRGSAYELFYSYLQNRRQSVKLNGIKSNYQTVNIGIPQGTVLGPILFLIYINNLGRSLHGHGDLVSYADDTVLVFRGKSWEETYRHAEEGLARVQDWLNYSLLSLNVNKTNFLAFSLIVGGQPVKNTLKIHSPFCKTLLNCNCPNIHKVKHIKYLGLYVDCYLRWNVHTEYLTNRLKCLIFKFYQLRCILDNKNLRIVYGALAESLIRYCIIVWGGLFSNALKPLQVMQNTVLKILFKKDIRHSTLALYRELNLLNMRTLYIYEMLLWTHEIDDLRSVSPNVGCSTRSSVSQALRVPLFHKSHTQNFLFYYGPKMYNLLPASIKNIRNKFLFKKHLKQYVINHQETFLELF